MAGSRRCWNVHMARMLLGNEKKEAVRWSGAALPPHLEASEFMYEEGDLSVGKSGFKALLRVICDDAEIAVLLMELDEAIERRGRERGIVRAVARILARGKVVTPADVLVELGRLTPKALEDWRRGRVPYLEKVISGSLSLLCRLLRILRFHAHDLNLVPSITVYMRWGKGPKQRLRFSKIGDPRIEEAYSRHFVWPGKRPDRLDTGGSRRRA